MTPQSPVLALVAMAYLGWRVANRVLFNPEMQAYGRWWRWLVAFAIVFIIMAVLDTVVRFAALAIPYQFSGTISAWMIIAIAIILWWRDKAAKYSAKSE